MKTIGTMTAVMLTIGMMLASPSMGTSPRRLCRRACEPRVEHACRRTPFSRINRRCRRNVIRDCIKHDPTPCEETLACFTACAELRQRCTSELTGVFAGDALCTQVIEDRCAGDGLAYCATPDTTVNGCNVVFAEDHRGQPLVTVTFAFDGAGFDYSPECVRVSPGTTVRFVGPFDQEPLVPGEVPNPDTTSPLVATSSGTTRDFVLDAPGVFGYFGEDLVMPHRGALPSLPWGAVIVDPSK